MDDADKAARKKKAQREYYLRNRERIIEKARQWRLENPERDRQLKRESAERNAEKRRQKWRENRDKHNAVQRAKRAASPEFCEEQRLYHKQWYKENKARASAYNAEWKRRNRDEVNLYNRARRLAGGQFLAEVADWVSVLRSDPCAYCGNAMQEVDHIEPIALGGAGDPMNLTAACKSCNGGKRDRPLLLFLLDRRQ